MEINFAGTLFMSFAAVIVFAVLLQVCVILLLKHQPLLLNMSLKMCELLFACIHHLRWPGGGQGKKHKSDFYKMEFCPELEITQKDYQNRCHLCHVTHNLLVGF